MGDKARIQMFYLTVWQSEPHPSGSKKYRPNASHWKTETEGKFAKKIIFLEVSFKTRMYNQLI